MNILSVSTIQYYVHICATVLSLNLAWAPFSQRARITPRPRPFYTPPPRLKELNTKLKHVMEEFRSKLPTAGLVIPSSIKERVKRAERCTQKISSLPAYKPRGRKKADSAYHNRVGRRADALRKESNIHVYTCTLRTHILLVQ